MPKQRQVILPIAGTEYRFDNELTNRRTIERSFREVQDNINVVSDKSDKDASLALRKYHFMFMGAK
jgi:hypothetical protein|tara:strand:+ start:1194 stop:1391 length:198 start_codon:yes stop_codon:yes gene_type:complete